jgi:hypothetical protein
MTPDSRAIDLSTRIEQACQNAEHWFRGLPAFPVRPIASGGAVVGFRGPTLLSEADCAFHFARHLNAAGFPWEDMHLEVSLSKWLYAAGHPASGPGGRWRADLIIAGREPFLAAELPAAVGGYAFDAVFEFKYLTNFWTVEGASKYSGPPGGRRDVEADVRKVSERYVHRGIARLAYVIAFEECDHQFPSGWAAQAELEYPGVRVRVLRGWN